MRAHAERSTKFSTIGSTDLQFGAFLQTYAPITIGPGTEFSDTLEPDNRRPANNKTATGWSSPARLPDAVNIGDSIWRPSIAANGNLYPTVIGKDGLKSLYMAAFKDGNDQPAKPLSFSTGTRFDVDPDVDPDESFLIFSSGRRIPNDPHERLFLVKKRGANWGEPVLIRYLNDVTRYGASNDNEPRLGPDGHTL